MTTPNHAPVNPAIARLLRVVRCMIKWMRTKYWLVLVSAVAIGLLFVWVTTHGRATYSKDWLLVSTPTLGIRTNAGATTSTVTFRAWNVGPRSIDFQVCWFECRAKTDRTLLATNQLKLVNIPLGPGASTNLTVDVSLGAVPVEDFLCCCKLNWFQQESPWRGHATEFGRRWFELFEAYWEEPSGPSQHLTNGTVFVANVEVADYFRWMHGFTRTQWLEDIARQQSAPAPTQGSGGEVLRYGRGPTADEMLELQARSVFAEFCRRSTNLKRDAEPTAAPNAAPPHR
jgi:hypothetical protein